MKTTSKIIDLPSIYEGERILNQIIDLSIKPTRTTYYSQGYQDLLNKEIWNNIHFTVDDMLSGKEAPSTGQHLECAFTALRSTIKIVLDKDPTLLIQLVEDGGHRLDHLEHEIEERISTSALTGAEYVHAKRCSSVIRTVFLIVTSHIEKDGVNHPVLESRSQSSLKKIIAMNNKVDQHISSMLDSVDKENLKANRTVWLAVTGVLTFTALYIHSFFGLDKENSAADQVLYFFGVR